MNIKIIILTLALLFSSQGLYAKAGNEHSFLLKADDTTSFMNYEFHHLAYEAAAQKDYENSYRIYSKLANKGDARAEYNIGMMYMKGIGVKRAKMDAYKWLRRASKHGNTEATLYFKQMNERYAAKTEAKEAKLAKNSEPKKEKKQNEETNESSVIEKNSPIAKIAKPQHSTPVVNTQTPVEQKKEDTSSSLMYIGIAFVVLILSLAVFFLKQPSHPDEKEKKSKKEKKGKKEAPVAQNSLAYKAQVYDITYSHVSDYHAALLKQVNMPQIKADPSKMQIYYMFIYGMIDYFCQLEKLSDTEQRRIFTTHMGQLEGKENITAITQSILEGQRDSSMYHFQAAGGISAQAWHEHKAADALSMLKKVLTEKRH